MNVVDESLSAALDFLLANDGTVIGVGPARGELDESQIGRALFNTYWFNHSDSDDRELVNLIREASRGKAERLRVWVRISEHQLVRCDLMMTPILGCNGDVVQIVARTEPTPSTPRRRGAIEPILKSLSSNAPPDLMRLSLALPMMRIDLSTQSIVDANDRLLKYLNLERDSLPMPLIDLIDASERDNVLESIAQFRSSQMERVIDARVLINNLLVETRLTISLDPGDHDQTTALITLHDRSSERIATELRNRADQLAAESARRDSTLRALERLIDACPTPIGVIEDGRLSHASQSLRERFDPDTLAALVANRRSDSRSDVVTLDEQRNVFGVIGSAPIGLNAIDPSTLFAMATIDVHGRIHHWNSTFARWAGATEVKVPSGLFDLLDTESRLALEVSLRKLESDPQTITLRFAQNGAACLCEIFQAGNEFVLLALDHTNAQRQIDEIENALAGERRLLDSLPTPLVRVDADGKLNWANRAAATCDLSSLESALAAVNSDESSSQCLTSDGLELRPIESSSSGRTFALIDHKEERETRRMTSRLNAIESLINSDPSLALLELDLQSGVTTANAAARELLRVSHDAPIILAELCSPADRVDVEKAFYGGSHSERERIDLEFHLDSTGQKLRALGQVYFDHENAAPVPAGAVARLIDVERERIPGIERNPITTALFESIEGAVRIYTPHTVRQNGAAIQLFGTEDINWQDVSAWQSRFTPRDARGNLISIDALPVQSAMRGESMTMEMTIDTPQGARRIRASAMPIFIDQAVVGCVCIDIDLTDEYELRQKLESLESRLNEQMTSAQASTAESLRLAEQLQVLQSNLIAHLPAPVIQLDPDGRLIRANEPALRLLGIDSTDNPFDSFEWFDAQDRPVSTSDLLDLLKRQDLLVASLHARRPDRSQSLWLEIHKSIAPDAITLLLRDRSREISMMASLSQLQTRINEISADAEARRLRMIGDHHALVTLIQIMCADVDSVAQPLALDRRLPADAHALARGTADVVSLAHRILEAALDRPRAIDLSVGAPRPGDLVQLAREAIRLIGPLATRLGRDISLHTDLTEAIVDVEPALARHAIVAALLSAIGNTPQRVRIELHLALSNDTVQLNIVCASSTSMKKTGLLQQFADALARTTGASLHSTNEPNECWSAQFNLASGASAVRPVATRPRCVLLVEDHESTSRVISRQLARVGCVVRTVRGAGEARLAMHESSDVDLILCDMSLPDGDPLELMSDLSAQFGLRGVALGAGSDQDLQSIRDAGFVERLAKPVDLVMLANVINHVVSMPRREVESSR